MLSVVVVAKANYAPLVEETNDATTNQQLYNKIDQTILQYLQELLNLRLDSKKLMEFATTRRLHGGLELMLPGAYYKTLT